MNLQQQAVEVVWQEAFQMWLIAWWGYWRWKQDK